jgi:hypothetical protein
MPAGALLAGLLATTFGTRTALWVLTALISASGLLYLPTPIRRLRDLPLHRPASGRLAVEPAASSLLRDLCASWAPSRLQLTARITGGDHEPSSTRGRSPAACRRNRSRRASRQDEGHDNKDGAGASQHGYGIASPSPLLRSSHDDSANLLSSLRTGCRIRVS